MQSSSVLSGPDGAALMSVRFTEAPELDEQLIQLTLPLIPGGSSSTKQH
jgi:hypothetical protein